MSSVGRYVHGFALSWSVWLVTGSAAWLSAVAMASALPSLLLRTAAGEAADRPGRSGLLALTHASGSALALLAMLALESGDGVEYRLWLLSLFYGAVSAFQGPAMTAALMSNAIRRGLDSRQAAAHLSLIANGARVASPLVAMVVIEHWSAAACFAGNSFVLAGAFLAIGLSTSARAVAQPRVGSEPGPNKAACGAPGHAWTCFGSTLGVLLPICLFSIPTLSLLPALAEPDPVEGSAPRLLGYLWMAAAAGGMLGAVGLEARSRWCSEDATPLIWPAFVVCGALIATANVTSQDARLICCVVVGAGISYLLGAAHARMQALAGECRRGEAGAAYCAAVVGAAPIGHLFVGAVSAFMGASSAVTLSALVCMAACFAVAVWPGMVKRSD